MLDPSIIAKLYTITQINEKIATLETAYLNAVENKEYNLDTTQSRQRVEQQDLKDIAKELGNWLIAKNILNGNDHANIYAGKFIRGI